MQKQKPEKQFQWYHEWCLKAVGWYPGRKIAVDSHVAHLEKIGYIVHPAAIAFLEEWGDLNIPVPMDFARPASPTGPGYRLQTSVLEENYIHEYYEDICIALNGYVCLIGTDSSVYGDVLIHEDGSFYWSLEAVLAKIGDSTPSFIFDLLENILPSSGQINFGTIQREDKDKV